MVKFPSKETGKQRKLSQPWHGPYRVTSVRDPDVVATKVYFPSEDRINVHQLRVTKCPIDFPAGYYWYGHKQHSSGKVPRWLDDMQEVTVIQGITQVENGLGDDVSSDVDLGQADLRDKDTDKSDDQPEDQSLCNVNRELLDTHYEHK